MDNLNRVSYVQVAPVRDLFGARQECLSDENRGNDKSSCRKRKSRYVSPLSEREIKRTEGTPDSLRSLMSATTIGASLTPTKSLMSQTTENSRTPESRSASPFPASPLFVDLTARESEGLRKRKRGLDEPISPFSGLLQESTPKSQKSIMSCTTAGASTHSLMSQATEYMSTPTSIGGSPFPATPVLIDLSTAANLLSTEGLEVPEPPVWLKPLNESMGFVQDMGDLILPWVTVAEVVYNKFLK